MFNIDASTLPVVHWIFEILTYAWVSGLLALGISKMVHFSESWALFLERKSVRIIFWFVVGETFLFFVFLGLGVILFRGI